MAGKGPSANLATMPIGVALGSGGVKGLAHIPILETLEFDKTQGIYAQCEPACGEIRARSNELLASG